MNRYIQEHKEVRFLILAHGWRMGKVFKCIKNGKLKDLGKRKRKDV